MLLLPHSLCTQGKKKLREKERETLTILLIINENGKQTNPSPNHLKKLASRSCGRRIWRLRRPKDYTIRTWTIKKKERKKTTQNIHFRCSATTQDIRVHNKKPGVHNAKKPNNQQKFMLTLTLKSKWKPIWYLSMPKHNELTIVSNFHVQCYCYHTRYPHTQTRK